VGAGTRGTRPEPEATPLIAACDGTMWRREDAAFRASGYARAMVVTIAGGHGKIAMRLTRLAADGGDDVIGLVRNPEHAADVSGQGASAVVCDLEQASVEEIAQAIAGADAAVFAAGAGPGSGAERKLTLDRDGAIKFLQAAAEAGVPRFIIISSTGAEAPPPGDDVFSVYLRAKAEADQAVQASDRQWTIVRPGGLTDDPGRGRVRIESVAFRGRVPREDVTALLLRLLHDDRFSGRVFYVNSGEDPIEQALERVVNS
jgi:nucleoside-diphosphate-sugar epimerase